MSIDCGKPTSFSISQNVRFIKSNILPRPIALKNFSTILTQSNNSFFFQLIIKSLKSEIISLILSSSDCTLN